MSITIKQLILIAPRQLGTNVLVCILQMKAHHACAKCSWERGKLWHTRGHKENPAAGAQVSHIWSWTEVTKQHALPYVRAHPRKNVKKMHIISLAGIKGFRAQRCNHLYSPTFHCKNPPVSSSNCSRRVSGETMCTWRVEPAIGQASCTCEELMRRRLEIVAASTKYYNILCCMHSALERFPSPQRLTPRLLRQPAELRI